MATYGYAGDFSSDDDEKLEQVPTKYDNSARPNKGQIEEAIESIKRLPYDQEINLNDEVLAGLLDYYQTQRGPIVDSTRKLYNKIALRLVRDSQSKATDGSPTNGNTNSNISNNNNNNNNNNNDNLLAKNSGDAFSSDDEDLEVVAKLNNPKRFDSSVVYGNNNLVDVEDNEEDKMEVDSETPSGAVRNNKPIELATTDEDSSNAGDENQDVSSSSEDASEASEPESDVLEVTPIRLPVNREKEAIETLMNMRPSTPKQAESSTKRQPLAHSTPKESFVDTAKKPYTRSQRVTTRSATKTSRDLQKLGKNISSSSADAFIEKERTSRRGYTLVTATVLVLLAAFLAYFFRSNIVKTAEPLFRKKLTF